MSVKKTLKQEEKAYVLSRAFKSTVDNIAQGLNISKNTLYNNLSDDQEFSKEYYKKIAERSDVLDDIWYEKAKSGDIVALRYYTHSNKISCEKELDEANIDKNNIIALRNFILKFYATKTTTKKEMERAIELMNKTIEVDNKLSLLENNNIDEVFNLLRKKSPNELSELNNNLDNEIQEIEKKLNEC